MTNQNDVGGVELQVTPALATLAWERAFAEGDDSGVDMSLRVARHVVRLLASPAAVGGAVSDVIAERRRQVEKEHWSSAHDDAHGSGVLALAGACYAISATGMPSDLIDPEASGVPVLWPWSPDWWKPKDERRDLVRAAALIIAEIERIDRNAPPAIASQEVGHG